MTAYRSNRRGTLILEKQWQGVRICRASGTEDRELFDRLCAMLDDLKRTKEWDLRAKAFRVWQGLASGQLTPIAVYQTYRLQGLVGLPDPEQLDTLEPRMRRWLEHATTRSGAPLSPVSKKTYGDAVTRLCTTTATLEDLPDLLRVRRETTPPDSFNIERTAALAFVRGTFGRHHPLWQAVASVEPLHPTRHDRKGLSPTAARRLAEQLGRDGWYWWTLCCTGMRSRSEYLANRWEVLPDRIVIHGTKSKAAERYVPRILDPVRCPLHYETLRLKLKAFDVTAHWARYTFRHFLEEAGIPPARANFYFGHSHAGLQVYGRHEYAEYLARDAGRLRELVGKGPQLLSVMA